MKIDMRNLLLTAILTLASLSATGAAVYLQPPRNPPAGDMLSGMWLDRTTAVTVAGSNNQGIISHLAAKAFSDESNFKPSTLLPFQLNKKHYYENNTP